MNAQTAKDFLAGRIPIRRRRFVVASLLTIVAKLGLDLLIIRLIGLDWIPWMRSTLGLLFGFRPFSQSDLEWAPWILAVSTVPFLVGVFLCLGRLRQLRLPLPLVLLLLVPGLKVLFYLTLLLLPDETPQHKDLPQGTGIRSQMAGWIGRVIPQNGVGAALVAVLAGSGMGFVAVVLLVKGMGAYGWVLFVATPFLMGFVATLVHSWHDSRTLVSGFGVTLFALAILGILLLLVAFEGVVCLLMASPLAILLGITGSAIGHQVAEAARHRKGGLLLGALILAPPLGFHEHLAHPAPEIRPVRTEILVQAPPETVWRNVVEFRELPAPTEWIFRTGIAYPIRARIEGTGVGAVRHCEFSTGPFVEPITVWEPPRFLAFSVTSNPAPMEEWTPYRHIHPPHLEGFLVSVKGQFELVPVPGGTRLVGTTWYRHGLYPDRYWRVWSDGIIHSIHLRVLRHIRDLSEQAGGGTRTDRNAR